MRYAAYATRVRTILLSAQRYVAYTSDIGESFRPIAHPWLIKSAYGISWAYLIGDVSHEGYKAYTQQQALLNPASGSGVPAVQATNGTMVGNTVRPIVPAIDDYRTVMAQRAVFQSVASMGLPAFTIHSIVRYSGKALKNAKNARIRTYGPIGVCSKNDVLGSSAANVLDADILVAGPCRSTILTIHVRQARRRIRRVGLPPGFQDDRRTKRSGACPEDGARGTPSEFNDTKGNGKDEDEDRDKRKGVIVGFVMTHV